MGSVSGRSFGGPGKYIQRAGEIARLAEHIQPLGSRVFVLIDPMAAKLFGTAVEQSLQEAGLKATIEIFGGECCNEEITRVTALARNAKADVIVGIGGGKTADTSKLTAIATEARIAIVTTIASTDVPCSAIAVRYDNDGVYQESMFLPRCHYSHRRLYDEPFRSPLSHNASPMRGS